MLTELLRRNDEHVDGLSETHFDAVQDGQQPSVVSICCSDSRVSQEDMFNVTEPGWLFTPSNIGNQACLSIDGEECIDGNLLYPVTHTGTRTIAVVGHTSCGAVTAAYKAINDELDLTEEPAGIRHMVEQLIPVVEEAITEGVVDPHEDDATVINQLVEYNVDRQVRALRASADIPDDTEVYGLVYDFQGIYGGEHGVTYLINVNGETDPAALRDRLDPDHTGHVKRLTQR